MNDSQMVEKRTLQDGDVVKVKFVNGRKGPEAHLPDGRHGFPKGFAAKVGEKRLVTLELHKHNHCWWLLPVEPDTAVQS